MKKILVVEDNEVIVKGLKYLLEQEGFNVKSCGNVNDAKYYIDKERYDLIILDITLPDGDGFSLCKYIKGMSDVPVMFLTAKDDEKDVVGGLDIGADDYVVKPFRNRELVSRINVILRRFENSNKIECGKVVIDTEATKVFVDNVETDFTALEYKILLLLYSNFNKTITREQILDKIWDVAGNFVNDNTLTVYIKRVRAKLGKNDNIKTVKGIGYRVDK